MKFIFKLFLCFYSMTFNSLADFQELPESNLDIVPSRELTYRSVSQGATFLYVYDAAENQEYKLRTGLGCIRALLDPPEDIKLSLFGFGKLITGRKETGYPLLKIETPYHKVSCKIIAVDLL